MDTLVAGMRFFACLLTGHVADLLVSAGDWAIGWLVGHRENNIKAWTMTGQLRCPHSGQ